MRRSILLALAVAGTVAAVSPARAAIYDEFLCSTFSYRCNREPALPPPQLAPAEAPAKPDKVAKHEKAARHRKVRHAATKAASPEAATSAAPEAR